MRHSLILFSALLVLSGCATYHRVYPVTDAAGKEGVHYSLPRTVITVKADIAMAKTKPGKYIEFASLLNIDPGPGPHNETHDYKLSSAEITTKPEPDPSQTYLVEIKGSGSERRSLTLGRSVAGLPTSAVSDAEDRRLDLAVKVFSGVLSIASTAATGGALTSAGVTDAQITAADTLLRGAIHSSKHADLDDATRIARTIHNLNGRIANLLGEIQAVDNEIAKQFADQVKGLRAERNALLANFVNTTTYKTWPATFDIRIDQTAVGNSIPLFRLSGDKGYASATGANPQVTLVNAIPSWAVNTGGTATHKDVEITITSSSTVDLADHLATPKTSTGEVRGFYFRVPRTVHLAVQHNSETTTETDAVLAQLGEVRSLPARIHGAKSSKYTLSFDEATGQLTSIGVDSTPLDPAVFDPAIAATKDYIAATSPAAKLSRRKTQLEHEKAVRDLEQEELLALIALFQSE